MKHYLTLISLLSGHFIGFLTFAVLGCAQASFVLAMTLYYGLNRVSFFAICSILLDIATNNFSAVLAYLLKKVLKFALMTEVNLEVLPWLDDDK